jgi:hypothetical protein
VDIAECSPGLDDAMTTWSLSSAFAGEWERGMRDAEGKAWHSPPVVNWMGREVREGDSCTTIDFVRSHDAAEHSQPLPTNGMFVAMMV